MALFDIKKILVGAGIAMVVFVAGADDASAQTRRQIERERQRIERENARYRRERERQYRNGSVVTRRTEQRVNNANFMNGYQQGLMAGEFDRRSGKYNRSNVYRGSGTSPNDGDPTSSDYIYRQGYLQGYEDGFRGVRNY